MTGSHDEIPLNPEGVTWIVIGSSLGSVTGRLRDVWSSQSQPARMIIGALGVLIVVGIAYFGFTRFRPRHVRDVVFEPRSPTMRTRS